jgi:hypothetical protein
MKNIRWATPEDWDFFYPEGRPFRARAMVLIDGEKPIGIGGFVFASSGLLFFSDITEACKKYPIAMIKLSKTLLSVASRYQCDIMAQQEPGSLTSPRFLSRLGFEQQQSGVWLWQCSRWSLAQR